MNTVKSSMQSLGSILTTFNPVEDKYISREFQSYGIYLSDQLHDERHKALYIKLAKTTHRSILEEALTFVKSARARSPARLFMWKIKQLRNYQSEDSIQAHSKNNGR